MRRKSLLRAIILTLSFLSIAGCQKFEYETPLIPLEDFFKNPQKTNFKLSPDGTYIAFLQPWESRLNIFVQKIGSKNIEQITVSSERDIRRYFWANNKKIVYLQDIEVNDNYALFSVDIDGSDLMQLTNSKNSTVKVVNELPDIENELIIESNDRDERFFDVVRINIETGERKLIGKNPGNIINWLTDHSGLLRVAIASDGVDSKVMYRDNENQEFKTIKHLGFMEEFHPIIFTYDNKYVYVASNVKSDRVAIIKYDLANDYELEIIYEHPKVDVKKMYYSRKKGKTVGVSFITWKTENLFWDAERDSLQRVLEKKLPGVEVTLVSFNKNEDKVLVRTYSDKSYGAYYFYDVVTHNFVKLTEISPWLNEKNMAEMKPISYIARDGLTIHGYLTLPNIVKAQNLPSVILPHGGPWYRDSWRFNSLVQFLANRGYAVLQMNYRGSTGYGKKFFEAGFKEWGLKIQDDVTDGTEWLIKQGIADPNRIAIFGSSFGGYIALSGLAFTPDLYSCGIVNAGISDIISFLESIPPTWTPFKKMLYEVIGDPVEEKEELIATSPYHHISNIKAPILIAQGAKDRKVKKSLTDNFVKKLKENNVKVIYMVKENEGHGFKNEENRIEYYRMAEKFLYKNLNGRIEKHK